MPLYEYRCSECGLEFEKMVRFSEADRLPDCPGCQSQNTRKKLSTVASFSSGDSGFSSGSSCTPRGGFS